uniref:Serpentine receptor class gamma n=1 Tax=Ditylenchus dipsaci TaxID=166011 RepID=A0A915DGI4_9BILA
MIPLLYSGVYYTWFFNPYIGYRKDPEKNYISIIHLVWNGNIAFGIPIFYIIFATLFIAKSCQVKGTKNTSKKQKMMLLQVFTISMMNFFACSISVYMMYTLPRKFWMHLEYYAWLNIHGTPPVIYLLFNSTIRQDTAKMLKALTGRANKSIIKQLAANDHRMKKVNVHTTLSSNTAKS